MGTPGEGSQTLLRFVYDRGFRGLRAATRALPLDPTAFEKAGETFMFS